ncbi:MAG TPA: sulfotransferase [Rhodopila sp.]|uniref:sulfotransferase family protein n=1 Tax=Rhodopila sp. TaxID=2480087 RepID=UPI002BD7A35D|nr:sulfotransferase [Rhodopila sp.]HVY17577.1 sulfotransferase [Rhodopila sp.]
MIKIIPGALRLADTVAGLLGLLDRPLDPDELIRLAREETGLRDFGDASFFGPLCRLLKSLSEESGLSLVGRSATRWDIVRFLSNLLVIEDSVKRDHGILGERVEKPIFITGLPRSGTTFLHRLMLDDPENRAPAVWETIYPSASAGSREQRIKRVAAQLRAFEWLAPEFRSLHPLDATSPQECSEITSHVFRSLRFDTTYLIPSYRQWMDADIQRHLPGSRFHKRFLQFLQHQDGRVSRWVLKCPEHLFALHAIRTVYPDARIVFVHRDPVKVLLSQARLTEVLRRPFTRRLDPRALGPDESHRWLDGTQKMIAASDDAKFAEPICHVHHIDLITDPVTTVEAVYKHFGMHMSGGVAQRIQQHVRAQPNGGYGKHHYRFEDHGLDEARERDRFRPYMVRFGISAETSSPNHAEHSKWPPAQVGALQA